MKKMIDKTTSSMTDNGLYQFYKSFTVFLMKLRAEKLSNAEEDDFRALTFDELRGPLIFCVYLVGFAWIIFLAEIIIIKLKK